MVEHLKVMAASRACFLDAYWVGLWSSASGPYQSSPVGPLPDGRAPKGPLQFTYFLLK